MELNYTQKRGLLRKMGELIHVPALAEAGGRFGCLRMGEYSAELIVRALVSSLARLNNISMSGIKAVVVARFKCIGLGYLSQWWRRAN